MHPVKEVIQKVKRVVKRRKKLLIFTPLFFVLLSWGALQLIEPKYESSTSILVQNDQALNPANLYDMRGASPAENKLQSFNKIILSRSSMEMLIDSLNFDRKIESKKEKQAMIKALRNKITTSSEASDSFEITFIDTDPQRAKDGAELLASYFIETRQQMESRSNSETVEFFKTKLKELENTLEKKREDVVSSTTDKLEDAPINQEALQKRLQAINTKIDELDWQIIQTQNKLSILENFLAQEGKGVSVKPLYKLPIEEIPLGEQLNELLAKHDKMKQEYTASYPQLKSLNQQIIDVAKRIPPAIESELSDLNELREEQRSKRENVINKMETAFVAKQQNSREQSNFSIYQKLVKNIKMKLEQAQMSREVGDKTAEQFFVLDPAFVPQEPSSPSKRLVMGIGFMLGIIIASLLMGVAEALDTTIRREEDLKFNKPVIAYLNDGRV